MTGQRVTGTEENGESSANDPARTRTRVVGVADQCPDDWDYHYYVNIL